MKKSKVFNNSVLQPILNSPVFNYIKFYCDFETVLVNGIHYICCFSIVGRGVFYYKSVDFIDEFNAKNKSRKLAIDFIQICGELKKNLFIENDTMVLFFFHNFNKFDSFFLISNLSEKEEYDINLITRNRTVYKMVVKNLLEDFQVEFRDTYLLLNVSLEKIGNVFCTNYKKKKIDFSINTLDIYKNMRNFEVLKKKIEHYCVLDSLVLKEGFENYIKDIKQSLFIDPLLCLSLPSLSMRIFLKDFYDVKNNPIENCEGNKEKFIRKSYKGGIVDVYKPHLEEGHHYDCNSLYPTVMFSFLYPSGIGFFVKPENINLNSFFGFAEAEVTCPEDLYIPFLTKYEKDRGLISPTGCWTGVFFSEELKLAQKLGYKIKILRGVSYEKKPLFVGIIDKFYGMRLKYPKESPMNIIFKLLMNSLYGRFGMKARIPTTQVVSEKKLNEILAIYEVLDKTPLNTKILVVYIKKPVLEKLNLLLDSGLMSKQKYDFLKDKALKDTSFTPVQIASAITAYARVYMHKYKTDLDNVIYYSDTDSIYCKKLLPDEYVSDSKLGFMKYCGEVSEAIFVAPKVYACFYNSSVDIKCKGINRGLVSVDDIKKMHKGNSRFFVNLLSFRKHYKKFIVEEIYQRIEISGSFLKRQKILDEKGVWVNTKPFNVNK